MEIYHLSELALRMAEKSPGKTALIFHDRKTNSWQKVRRDEMGMRVMAAARGLAEIGMQPHDRVGIYSQNMRFCLWAEMGIFAMRGVSVPLYATSSPEQVDFVVRDAGIETLFVGEQYQYNNAYPLQSNGSPLKRIVIFDKRVVKNPEDTTSIYYDEFVRRGESMPNETIVKVNCAEASDNDLAVIIYTSGTTGKIKGVTITHAAMMWQIRVHKEKFPFIGFHDVSMNFLPLSHVFEKLWCYFCLSVGARVAVLSDPKRVQEALPRIKPTLMCNVPRFWEKIYQGVEEKIEGSPRLLQRVFRHAIRTGKRFLLDYRNERRKAPPGLYLLYHLYNNTIFNLLKTKIGLQRIRFCPTAGAPLSDEINIFLQSVNFPLVIGYGLSESAATVACYPRRGFVISSIGEVIPGMEVRIDPQTGEIQLKGPAITQGYYHNDEANREAFTSDGWFRTGDAGRLEGRTLYFSERIKDLYKTANGKYIAPQQIEGLMTSDRLMEQVAVIGDKFKFVSALIYPNWSVLRRIAIEREPDLAAKTNAELCNEKEVVRLVMAHVEKAQASLAQFEKVKRITLLCEPFSIEGGELTNTLKLRRKIVLERYADQIRQMYDENKK